MRPVAKARTSARRQPGRRATQPSGTPSDVRTTGPQGTPGGTARMPTMPRRKPGVARQPLKIGQEKYLWILVFIEVAAIGGFRKYFRRFHGG